MEVCAFTGHRALSGDFDILVLDRVIERLIKLGVKRFLCGCAMGFDIIAAERVLIKREEFKDIELCACIPYPGQSKSFPLNYKERYEKILSACDEKIVLSENYYRGCMHVRDRFMVDNADVLVCYLRKKQGGTYYTFKYAESKDIKIIEL